MKPRYIDMTPTWTEIAPTIAHVLENATQEGRDTIRPELMRMAALADERNAIVQAAERMSEADLIATINATVALWVGEEWQANDDSISAEKRLAPFLAALARSWMESRPIETTATETKES